ncbi:MAG: zinc dependent phospholipase C family protein [Bacteroidota bacterium]
MSWGFFAHQKINRIAVFSLPPEMIGFYKAHITYLTEKAVNPDMRRYVVDNEAPRHYIDLDVYGDSAAYTLPRYWLEAVDEFGEDSLQAYGIVPWHIAAVKYWLTQAFLDQDMDAILRLSADLGHYVGDANVPLHTTENYNGQLTNQYGIHGFWESRLPELFFEEYDLFVGKAEYEPNVQIRAWDAVIGANQALDSVLLFEKELSKRLGDSKKYSFEQRGQSLVKVYSYDFSKAYHRRLNGMVGRQLRKAIKMTADLWYTAWVDGGQPDLKKLIEMDFIEEELVRVDSVLNEHEAGIIENQ